MNATLNRLALDILTDLPIEFRKGSPEVYQELLAELQREASSVSEPLSFKVTEVIHHKIDSINSEVATLCTAIKEPIRVLVRWDADRWGRGEYWLRVEADIYGKSEEDFEDNEAALKAWVSLDESEADREVRYDGSYNWTSLGSDMEKADELAQQYIAHQKTLYPDCEIVLD